MILLIALVLASLDVFRLLELVLGRKDICVCMQGTHLAVHKNIQGGFRIELSPAARRMNLCRVTTIQSLVLQLLKQIAATVAVYSVSAWG